MVDVTIPSKAPEQKPFIRQEKFTFLNQCIFDTYSPKRELVNTGVCDPDPRKFEVKQDVSP